MKNPKHQCTAGLGYRAYLRQVITGKDPGYLTSSSDSQIKAGATAARKDIIDFATAIGESQKSFVILTPAYGQDYDTEEDTVHAFVNNEDFVCHDSTSLWYKRSCNKSDLQGAGVEAVRILYNDAKRKVQINL